MQSIGEDLAKLGRPVEVRCAADVVELLKPAFAPSTQFRIPIASSRPRLIRLIYQQVVAPMLDRRSTLLVCPGDQAPLWGRARVLLVVYDVRRLTKANDAQRLETLFYRLVVPRGARRASGLITASEFSRRELERAIDGQLPQIRVVGHQTQTRSVSHEAAGTGTLLVVGAMRPYKGIETVIDALALVDGAVRPTLTLVGSTEGRREEIERYALVRGVRRSLTIRGWIDEDTLEHLYGGALATVNPSTYEGYGLPVAESLAHGVPTIASDIPPHREIADGAALFFRAAKRPLTRCADHARRARRASAHEALAGRAEPISSHRGLGADVGRTRSRRRGSARVIRLPHSLARALLPPDTRERRASCRAVRQGSNWRFSMSAASRDTSNRLSTECVS